MNLKKKCRRDQEILIERKRGLTYERIGQLFGLSKQRVHQILKRISKEMIGNENSRSE